MLTCTISGISWDNLLHPETNAFTSNPCHRQTTWPKWMKFWCKKRQYVLFMTRPISNTWLLASVSKSLTESDNSAGWPGSRNKSCSKSSNLVFPRPYLKQLITSLMKVLALLKLDGETHLLASTKMPKSMRPCVKMVPPLLHWPRSTPETQFYHHDINK